MTNILFSTLETYLMDEEVELDRYEDSIKEHSEQLHPEEFPSGFFSSL